jgi:hypothetical protein
MAKKKSQPKPASKASFASKTAPRVKDATEKHTSSSQEETDTSTASNSTAEQDDATPSTPKKKTAASGPAVRNNIIKAKKRGPLAIVSRPKTKTNKTRILTEIKNLQRSTELLIPRAPFLRLVNKFKFFILKYFFRQ